MRDKRTLDDTTAASNPGNVELSKWVWFRHNSKPVSLLTLFLVGSILSAIFINAWLLLVVGIAIFINIFYWTRTREHFLYGHSNSGIVVATHPTLVAVSGDLSKGYGYFPAIKITKRASLKNVSIGDRLPTVALYTASSENSLSYWIDFDPVPLSYATNNPQVTESAMKSYPSEQWKQLEKQLSQVDQPYKAGLYLVDEEYSDWNVTSDKSHVLSNVEENSGISLTTTILGAAIFIALLYVLQSFS